MPHPPQLPPDYPRPIYILTKPASTHPAIPAGRTLVCTNGPYETAQSDRCPVIQQFGLTYWVYSFVDNRQSVSVVAYDDTGKIIKEMEFPGTRFIWRIAFDMSRKTITFSGQGTSTAQAKFSDMVYNVAVGSWVLEKIENNTDQHVMFGFHVPSNGVKDSAAMNSLTMVGVLMERDGILSFDPKGATPECQYKLWRTEITHGSDVWEFYHDNGTSLTIRINAGPQFEFVPDRSGQVVAFGQHPKC